MLNNTELEIISLFLRTPFETYTVYSTAKKLRRYVSQVQKAMKQLERKNVVTIKKIGTKTSSCSINFSKSDIDLLTFAAVYAKKSFINKNIKIKVITKEMEKKLAEHLYIMILFGSYAKGTSKNDSDIDLCLVIEDEKNIEKFKSKLNSILGKFSYKIHTNVFTTEWLYDMMKKKDTVGREILKTSVILQGYDQYYRLVKKYDEETGYSESGFAI